MPSAATNFPPYKVAPVSSLIPYARNARTHNAAQVAQIAASIREFGFTNPILVDRDRGVIAGHGRLLAACQLGMTEVPTIELSDLTAAQKRAYIIADNKLALSAGWDDEPAGSLTPTTSPPCPRRRSAGSGTFGAWANTGWSAATAPTPWRSNWHWPVQGRTSW